MRARRRLLPPVVCSCLGEVPCLVNDTLRVAETARFLMLSLCTTARYPNCSHSLLARNPLSIPARIVVPRAMGCVCHGQYTMGLANSSQGSSSQHLTSGAHVFLSIPWICFLRAMFSLRNRGGEAAALALASAFKDEDNALFKHEVRMRRGRKPTRCYIHTAAGGFTCAVLVPRIRSLSALDCCDL